MDLKSKIILISGPTASGKPNFSIKLAKIINGIIIEAQKLRVRSAKDLEKITKDVLKSNQKTILLAIYNNQNQRRYIGIKLN